MTQRRCTKCGIDKSLSQFTTHPKGRGGRYSWCSSCNAANSRAWYHGKCKNNNRNREQLPLTTLRLCTSCGDSKNLSEYYRSPNALGGYMRRCKTCILARRSEHYLANTAVVKARVKTYARNNPGKLRALSAARKSALRRATPTWLTLIHRAQLQEVYEVALAVTVQTGVPHEVDHIYPLRARTACGLHVPWNLQVIPAKDNNTKRNKMPADLSHLPTAV